MTFEIAILFAIILGLILLLAFEVLPSDTLALTLMVVLIVGGFVSPQEGIAGLSNQATVTILALMILTVGLETTGVITALGKYLKRWLSGRELPTIVFLMVIVGSASAFISTTAVVIVFLRIMIKLSRKMPTNLSRILMPLSFAGILGGSCTLLGTSTNLLVSSIAREYELASFGVFEFTHIGLIFFLAGLGYMALIGRRLIPARKKTGEDLTEEYAIQPYLAEVIIKPSSRLIGKRIDETPFFHDQEIDLIEIKRPGAPAHFPTEVERFQAGDLLLIKGSVEKIAELRHTNELGLRPEPAIQGEERLNTSDMTLCEVIVRPSFRLAGQALNKVNLKLDYNAIPLAVKKNQQYFRSDLQELRIEAGDTLLMEVGRANFERFYNSPEFVVLQEHEDLAARTEKQYTAAVIVVMVIVLAATNVMPILVSALAGCVLMFLTGCLDLKRAYRRVDWSVYFLLAGVIPLGTAMNNTGASQWISQLFIEGFGEVSPRTLVSVLFLFTMLLSAVISNNATAILLAPIVVSIAARLAIDPRPLLLTIMFAANMSFLSPIGYQTNTLIYGPGAYRFTDFIKVGGGLSLLIWVLATLLIPMFYF